MSKNAYPEEENDTGTVRYRFDRISIHNTVKSVEIKLFFYFQLNVLHIFERMRNQRQGALNLVLFPLIMLKLAS